MTNYPADIEESFAEAKKYSTRSEFACSSKKHYMRLWKRGLLDLACAHMLISPRFSYKKWTADEVFSIASTYQRRSDFRRENEGAYAFALANKLLEPACAHMNGAGATVRAQKFWHVFELMCAAKKYSHKEEFKKKEPAAYNYAAQSGLLYVAQAHMESDRTEWTKDMVMEKALDFASKSDFFAAFPGAYKHAEKYGYWEDACAHMPVKKRIIGKEFVLDVARQHDNRTAFQMADPSAYSIALRDGYLDEACAHMEARLRSLNKDFVMAEAKKYKSRISFKDQDPSCYAHAFRNGFLEDACAHMGPPLPSGFKDAKSATLYFLRISGSDAVVYKIGITNNTPEKRIQGMGLSSGFSVDVLHTIKFESGREARMHEKRLHRQFAEHRYLGPAVMENGNTELFTVNVLDFIEIKE